MASNTQQPKAANTIPTSTCQSHLSTPAPETFRKVSTVKYACLYPYGPTNTEQQRQAQNATNLFPTLPTSILIGWTYHHITAVTGPKRHTVNSHPPSLHPYNLHCSIMSDKNHFCSFMDVVKNSSPLRTCAAIYHIHSRVIKNLIDEYESHQISRTRQEKEPLVNTKKSESDHHMGLRTTRFEPYQSVIHQLGVVDCISDLGSV